MKILFWTPTFWPDVGGIQLISMRHIQSLKNQGHDCVVLTSFGRVEAPAISDLDGILIYRFPIIQAFQNKDLRQLFAIQKEIETIKRSFSPDLEHLNFGGATPIGFIYLRSLTVQPIPLVVALHGSVLGLDGGVDSVTSQILRKANWTTACSAAILDDARQILPEIASRSSVVYLGCADVDISPTPLPFEDVRILCLGRLVPEKGFDVAISAFAQVVATYPNIRLIIAGDGSARTSLEQQVDNLHLTSRVKFTGKIEPQMVYELINKTTMLVVPSRWREAFGLVALEAAQMARPVIASRVGGLVEAVLDGETGLLVESENIPAFAESIVWMIENPERAVQMGLAGYNRTRTDFSWEKYSNAYDSIYRRVRQEKL